MAKPIKIQAVMNRNESYVKRRSCWQVCARQLRRSDTGRRPLNLTSRISLDAQEIKLDSHVWIRSHLKHFFDFSTASFLTQNQKLVGFRSWSNMFRDHRLQNSLNTWCKNNSMNIYNLFNTASEVMVANIVRNDLHYEVLQNWCTCPSCT